MKLNETYIYDQEIPQNFNSIGMNTYNVFYNIGSLILYFLFIVVF